MTNAPACNGEVRHEQYSNRKHEYSTNTNNKVYIGLLVDKMHLILLTVIEEYAFFLAKFITYLSVASKDDKSNRREESQVWESHVSLQEGTTV